MKIKVSSSLACFTIWGHALAFLTPSQISLPSFLPKGTSTPSPYASNHPRFATTDNKGGASIIETTHNEGHCEGSQESDSNRCMAFGMLISSFTDGVLASNDAKEFLKYSLVSTLTKHAIRQVEEKLADSVKASPCAGPNINFLNQFEEGHAILEAKDVPNSEKTEHMLTYLSSLSSRASLHQLRVLYIPTAMYALRKDSTNTPGKQRQRARADGKKKRTQVINSLKELFLSENDTDGVDILTVTLDLGDGSLKQPEGSTNPSLFPKDGREALTSWAPHLIYVEGGNTFWLAHCVEENDWSNLLVDAVVATGDDALTSSASSTIPAVYIGKSAGAIMAGKYIETATWKEWDDPSVVPGMEKYDDWKGVKGLNLAGQSSFFPHMTPDWEELVQRKKNGITARDERCDKSNDSLYCIQEGESFCFDGYTSFLASA